jgi:hypothetical protein
MKLNYEFSIQEVADKFVAVAKNPETETVEHVFNLNETGALILEALQDGKDESAVVTLLLSQYDVEAPEAEAEVRAFVDMLVENGLAVR